MRFIDLAKHGGCSKKAPAQELRSLLAKVHEEVGGRQLRVLAHEFPDTGCYPINGVDLISTVDIVLPMVLDPIDFGVIVVNHVLSDIYAGLALPLFALCILGVPNGIAVDAPEICSTIGSAVKRLGEENTALVGGHTMAAQDDLYLGFAAVGGGPLQKGRLQGTPRISDSIIITKPLGTSVATLRWKMEEASAGEHSDVLDGMLKSSRAAVEKLTSYQISACTDVTGYGLLGHLHNILRAHGVAARVFNSRIPVYESLKGLKFLEQTRQYWHNKEYVSSKVKVETTLGELGERVLYDSQVSGGLLLIARSRDAGAIVRDLGEVGYTAAVIGEIEKGKPGHITVGA